MLNDEYEKNEFFSIVFLGIVLGGVVWFFGTERLIGAFNYLFPVLIEIYLIGLGVLAIILTWAALKGRAEQRRERMVR